MKRLEEAEEEANVNAANDGMMGAEKANEMMTGTHHPVHLPNSIMAALEPWNRTHR